ncbi:MAG: response regulator [Pseudomonadales bacterium]
MARFESESNKRDAQRQLLQHALPEYGRGTLKAYEFMEKYHSVDILMVDDDELDVELFRRSLTKNRIANRLVWAQDGVEALEILQGKRAESIEQPAIVLLDINMPRMNGLEFLDAIRADPALKTLTVFVLTTSQDDRDIARAYENNVAGYMVKSELGESFAEGIGLLDHYWRVVELPSDSAT